MKVLVIAPHPDDEVFGCGGTIARHSAMGDEVHILIVTQGIPELFPPEHIRKLHEEMYAAHKLLGVKSTRIMDFQAPLLDATPEYKIASAINEVIREIEPVYVYLPHHGDLHADHKSVYTATLVATRPINRCSVRKLLSYETLSETDWSPPFAENTFVPTVYVDITKHLKIKLQAIQCYQSQLKLFPHTRSLESLKALARVRGGTVSLAAAEAFMLVRQIVP